MLITSLIRYHHGKLVLLLSVDTKLVTSESPFMCLVFENNSTVLNVNLWYLQTIFAFFSCVIFESIKHDSSKISNWNSYKFSQISIDVLVLVCYMCCSIDQWCPTWRPAKVMQETSKSLFNTMHDNIGICNSCLGWCKRRVELKHHG